MIVHILGETEDIQRKLWFAAHGVDVAECVGCGDLSVEIWIIDNRRKKIRCLHERRIVIQYVDACIVAFVIAYDQPGIGMGFEALQHARKRTCANFCAASRALRQFCQFHIGFHMCLLSCFQRDREGDIRWPRRRRFAQSPAVVFQDILLQTAHTCRSCCSGSLERASPLQAILVLYSRV